MCRRPIGWQVCARIWLLSFIFFLTVSHVSALNACCVRRGVFGDDGRNTLVWWFEFFPFDLFWLDSNHLRLEYQYQDIWWKILCNLILSPHAGVYEFSNFRGTYCVSQYSLNMLRYYINAISCQLLQVGVSKICVYFLPMPGQPLDKNLTIICVSETQSLSSFNHTEKLNMFKMWVTHLLNSHVCLATDYFVCWSISQKVSPPF